jgi:hypothetical protein
VFFGFQRSTVTVERGNFEKDLPTVAVSCQEEIKDALKVIELSCQSTAVKLQYKRIRRNTVCYITVSGFYFMENAVKKNILSYAVLVALTVPFAAYAQDSTTTTTTTTTKHHHPVKSVEHGAEDVGKDTEKGAKAVGRDTEKGAKAMGRDTEKGAKAVGRGTEHGAKDVVKGTEKGFKAMGSGVKKGWDKVTGKSKKTTSTSQ